MKNIIKKLNGAELERKLKAKNYIVWYSGNLPKTITRVERISNISKNNRCINESGKLKTVNYLSKNIEYSIEYIKSVYSLGIINILSKKEYMDLFKYEYITIKNISDTSEKFNKNRIKQKLFNDMFKTYVEHYKLFVDLITDKNNK